MRRAALAALAAAALLVGGCFGSPPNTAPQVHAGVSADQAGVGQEVVFTGQAVDSEGSVVRYDWDFEDDGVVDFTNATRGAALHSYARPGTYFARFTATDDRGASASIVVTVIVVAQFDVRADWGADEGYLVVKPATLAPANITVVVSPSGAPAPFTFRTGAGLESVNDTLLRVSVPRDLLDRYAVTKVEVFFDGTRGGERTLRAVPFFGAENDTAVTFSASILETRVLGAVNQTLSLSGTLAQDMPASVAARRFAGTGTSSSQAGGPSSWSASNYTFSSVTFTQSVGRDNGSLRPVVEEWAGTGTLGSTSTSGMSIEVNLTRYEGARVQGQLTYQQAEGNGTYSGTALNTAGQVRYALGGNETIVFLDGAGVSRGALRVVGNVTLSGTLGGASYLESNITETFVARDERLMNEDLFSAWNTSGHIGATAISSSGSRFPDADGNGVPNPDPRPALASDAAAFFGLAPARLEHGDAFQVRNALGAAAMLRAQSVTTQVLTATGFAPEAIEVAHLEGAVAGGGLVGALNASVVRDGPHAGLHLAERLDLASASGSYTVVLELIAKGA